jgi:hypothetical protein
MPCACKHNTCVDCDIYRRSKSGMIEELDAAENNEEDSTVNLSLLSNKNNSTNNNEFSNTVIVEHKVTAFKIPIWFPIKSCAKQRTKIRPWNRFKSLEAPRQGVLRANIYDTKDKKKTTTVVTEEPRTITGGFMTVTILILVIISVLFGVLNRVDPLTAELDKRNDVVNKMLSQFVMKFEAQATDVICEIFHQPTNSYRVDHANGFAIYPVDSFGNVTTQSFINITKIEETGNFVDYMITISSVGLYFDGTQDLSVLLKRECFSIVNFRPIAQLRKTSVNGTYFIEAEHRIPYYEAAAIYSRNFRYSWNVTMDQNYDLVKFDSTWYALEPIVDVVTSNDMITYYQNVLAEIYPVLNFSTPTGDEYAKYVMESKDCFMFKEDPASTRLSDTIQVQFAVDNTVKQRFYEGNTSRLLRIPLNILASVGSLVALRGPTTWLVLLVINLLSGLLLLKSVFVSLVILALTGAHMLVYSLQAIQNPAEFESRAVYYSIAVVVNCILVAIAFHFMLIWNMEFLSKFRQVEFYDLWSVFIQPIRLMRHGFREITGVNKAVFVCYTIVYVVSFIISVTLGALSFAHWICGPISVLVEVLSVTLLHLIWTIYLKGVFRLGEGPTDDELVAFIPIH